MIKEVFIFFVYQIKKLLFRIVKNKLYLFRQNKNKNVFLPKI